MPAEAVDGQDVLAVREAMDRAVAPGADRVEGPTLLEVRTYRFVGHSMSRRRARSYRTKDEVEEYRTPRPDQGAGGADARAERGWTMTRLVEALDAEVEGRGGGRLRVRRESRPIPIRSRALRRRVRDPSRRRTRWPSLTYRDALNQALREEMQRDDRVFLMGEEVAEYDGAYKVSRGLLEQFGARAGRGHADRRAGIRRHRRRRGDGRAAAGHRDDDLELRAPGHRPDRQHRRQDALHVGRPVRRARSCSAGPAGRRCQLGAQHSQAFESWYAHIPGLKVVSCRRRPPTPRGCSRAPSATTTR